MGTEQRQVKYNQKSTKWLRKRKYHITKIKIGSRAEEVKYNKKSQIVAEQKQSNYSKQSEIDSGQKKFKDIKKEKWLWGRRWSSIEKRRKGCGTEKQRQNKAKNGCGSK